MDHTLPRPLRPRLVASTDPRRAALESFVRRAFRDTWGAEVTGPSARPQVTTSMPPRRRMSRGVR
ncbi:MAG: hypothetical protein D6739_03490, partial [Nitrospirae bacterium]